MRIGITDKFGRLGSVLSELYGYTFATPESAHMYDLIIHNAAHTDVDNCEKNPDKAIYHNYFFTKELRESTNARIIYISTDFVFDGVDGYYDEQDIPNPLSVYGWTKLLGEKTLDSKDLIIRTTGLYGNPKRHDFVTWVLKKFDEGIPFFVSNRVMTTPTNVYHLAKAITHIIDRQLYNQLLIINIVGYSLLSKFMFAKRVGEVFGKDITLVRPSNDKSFGLAKRPMFGGLSSYTAKIHGIPIYDLDMGLMLMKEMMNEG